MGFNTTVVVLNDALEFIREDKEFGENLVRAILTMPMSERPIHVPAGSHANAASVIESHHADMLEIISVGGNTGHSIGYGGGYRTSDLEILRVLASKMGYRLVKKTLPQAEGLPDL